MSSLLVDVKDGRVKQMLATPIDGGVWINHASEGECRCAYFYRVDEESGEAKYTTSVACPSYPRCHFPASAAEQAAQSVFDQECVTPVVVKDEPITALNIYDPGWGYCGE